MNRLKESERTNEIERIKTLHEELKSLLIKGEDLEVLGFQKNFTCVAQDVKTCFTLRAVYSNSFLGTEKMIVQTFLYDYLGAKEYLKEVRSMATATATPKGRNG